MACCLHIEAEDRSRPFRDGGPAVIDDECILFDKRRSKLPTIFVDDPTYNEHRVTLQDWTSLYEASDRDLVRKQANCRTARSDLYQILGLFFVFQGVVLTAIAQASKLTCHNWHLPFVLCLLTSVAAFGACVQKLNDLSGFTKQHHLQRAYHVSLRRSIEKLKEEGTGFNVQDGQPELKGLYTDAEWSGKGTMDRLRSSLWQFCSMWIFSYAGAVLFLLCLFSGVTLFCVHQILCNPGSR